MSSVPEQLNQKTAFGEATVAQKDPEIQVSAQYNTSDQVRSIVLNGTVEIVGGEFTSNAGTLANSFASIFTDRQIIARPGQGSEIIFGARFDPGLVGSRQTAGPSTASDAITFGFNETVFGVRFNSNGLVIVEELQITTPAGGNEATTITVNGTGFTVDITSGTVQHNATEIAASLNTQVFLFNFTANGDTVVARSVLAEPESGSFAFSSPGAAVAVWTQIADGREPDTVFTAQDQWSEDTFQSLDPTKINTYKVVHNGDVCYHILDGTTGEYVLVHREIHTNTFESPMFSTSTFRIAWTAQNMTNTTDHAVRGTYAAAFNQGERQRLKGTRAVAITQAGVGTTPLNMVTIRCREVFGTKVNLGRILPTGLAISTDGNKGAIIQLIKGATFDTLEAIYEYTDKVGSIAETTTVPSEIIGGELVLAVAAGASSALIGDNDLVLTLLPGETLTIAMNVPSGAAADMNVSLVWEEDL